MENLLEDQPTFLRKKINHWCVPLKQKDSSPLQYVCVSFSHRTETMQNMQLCFERVGKGKGRKLRTEKNWSWLDVLLIADYLDTHWLCNSLLKVVLKSQCLYLARHGCISKEKQKKNYKFRGNPSQFPKKKNHNGSIPLKQRDFFLLFWQEHSVLNVNIYTMFWTSERESCMGLHECQHYLALVAQQRKQRQFSRSVQFMESRFCVQNDDSRMKFIKWVGKTQISG